MSHLPPVALSPLARLSSRANRKWRGARPRAPWRNVHLPPVAGGTIEGVIGDDTHATFGKLPHLTNGGKTYFITFCTRTRCVLPPQARDIVMRCCLHDHEKTHWLNSLTIMPEHVHLITTPYQQYSPAGIIGRIKSASAHQVNRCMGWRGRLWQREHFDRIMRSDNEVAETAEYIAQNAVRVGLAKTPGDYPWYWCSKGAR